MFTFSFNETKLKELTTRIPLESRISQIFMCTWGTTTTVLPPAGLEGKYGRFKGKYVNRKTAGQLTKITEFPRKNGQVDRYGLNPPSVWIVSMSGGGERRSAKTGSFLARGHNNTCSCSCSEIMVITLVRVTTDTYSTLFSLLYLS